LDGVTVGLLLTDPPYNVRVEPRSNNAIAAGMSRQWDAAYAESLANAPSGRKALDAQGLHHSGFDVARGKSGVGKNQKLDLERHPEKARATHRKLRAKDRPLANDVMSDADFEASFGSGSATPLACSGPVVASTSGAASWTGPTTRQRSKGAGLYFSGALIRVKEHPVLTRTDSMTNHELAFYGWREGAAHRFFGPPNVPDVWPVKKVSPNRMVHLTEKPVELARRAIGYSSLPREVVPDPFAGSGSTLVGVRRYREPSYRLTLVGRTTRTCTPVSGQPVSVVRTRSAPRTRAVASTRASGKRRDRPWRARNAAASRAMSRVAGSTTAGSASMKASTITAES
jgi:hypothetical protein